MKVLALAFTRRRLDLRDDHTLNAARQHRAADHHRVRSLFTTQRFTDFTRDMFDVGQVRLSAFLAGCAHANEREVGIANGFAGVRSCAEATGAVDVRQKFGQTRLEQRRLACME